MRKTQRCANYIATYNNEQKGGLGCCGKQNSRWLPVIPAPGIHVLYTSSPLSVSGTTDYNGISLP